MRPVTRIIVPFERNQKEIIPNSERGQLVPTRRENVERKEAIAKGGKGINTRTLFVAFVFTLSAAIQPASNLEILSIERYRYAQISRMGSTNQESRNT